MQWSSVASSPFSSPIGFSQQPMSGFAVQQVVFGPGGQPFLKQQNFAIQQQCGNCGGIGHGRMQCPSFAPVCALCRGGHATSNHKCNNCGVSGRHRMRDCPQLAQRQFAVALGGSNGRAVYVGSSAQVHNLVAGLNAGLPQP